MQYYASEPTTSLLGIYELLFIMLLLSSEWIIMGSLSGRHLTGNLKEGRSLEFLATFPRNPSSVHGRLRIRKFCVNSMIPVTMPPLFQLYHGHLRLFVACKGIVQVNSISSGASYILTGWQALNLVSTMVLKSLTHDQEGLREVYPCPS